MIHSDFNGFSLFFTNLQILSLKKIKIKIFKLKIVFKRIYLFLHDNQKNIVQLGNKKPRGIPNDSLPPFCILTCKHSQ